jgi:hypothetical protein
MAVDAAEARVRGDEGPVKRIPGLGTFELSCDGPGWKALPVVNGHVCPVASVDVHVDPEHFPEVTLRLVAADLLKLGLDPATIKTDDETREALISLGWTPPDDGGACACGSRHPEGYECTIKTGPASG